MPGRRSSGRMERFAEQNRLFEREPEIRRDRSRRNNMNTGWKKAAVIGLSAGLALSGLSGCSKGEFNPQAAAVTVNDQEISAGLLKFATHYNQAQSESLYASMTGSANPFNQDIYGNGTTLGSMMTESVATQLANAVLTEQKMEEYGVSLSEEEKASITETAQTFLSDNDEEVLELMGADQATVERYLELSMIQHKMEEAMSADVDTEVSDEEAAQRKIQYTLFTPVTEEETEAESESETESGAEAESETETETASLEENEDAQATQSAEEETETESETAEEATDAESESETAEEATDAETEAESETETEDPETAAAKAKAYDKAVAMIEKIQAGEEFAAASEEVDPDATCSTMTFGESDGQEALLEATDGLADGTLVEEPVETDSGYYVVYLETQLDREATDAEKEQIVEQRKQDQISELYTQWQEDSEIDTDAGVLSDITFDFSLQREVETEVSTEASTEAVSEGSTESGTEETTESAESETETSSEEVTEAVAEESAESETEVQSETEAQTESEEAGTETEIETETETEA